MMRTLLSDLLTVTGFFTRIPVSGAFEPKLGDAIWAAPVVGLMVGAASSLAFFICHALRLPSEVSAVVAIAVALLMTGALHEDGLADLADGFGGGATRERKLEIMRDSRIGTFGVVALVVVLIAKCSAIGALGSASAIIAAHVFSRGLIPAFMVVVPPARPSGLSAGAGAVSITSATLAFALGFAGLLLIGLAPAMIAAVAGIVAFLGLKHLCERQIGGQTGDVLGTLQQIVELVVLLVAAAFIHTA